MQGAGGKVYAELGGGEGVNLRILFNKIFRRKSWNRFVENAEKAPDGSSCLTMDAGLNISTIQKLVAEMASVMEMYTAPNFLTMTVLDPRTLKKWDLTIRRPDGISPGAKIRQLEEKIKYLEKIIEEEEIQRGAWDNTCLEEATDV